MSLNIIKHNQILQNNNKTEEKRIEHRIIPNTNDRYIAYTNGDIFDTKNDRFIAQNKNKRGWLNCHIWSNNKRITMGVHRIIMYTFKGFSELSVNHIDGNKENNNLCNLEYANAKEQAIHRSRVLKVGNRKSVICVETQEIFETATDAGISKGFDPSHISGVCKNKYGYKTTGGYHWRYI